MRVMGLKYFFIFAMRNIFNRFVKSKQSLFTYLIGIVPNSFYCKVVSVFRNSKGAIPPFTSLFKLFTNAKHSKYKKLYPRPWCKRAMGVFFAVFTNPKIPIFMRVMGLKYFFIFAMRHLLNCIINQLEFFVKQRIGVVSLNSFCYAIGGCRNSEGATLLLFIKINYFLNATPRKYTNFLYPRPWCNRAMGVFYAVFTNPKIPYIL